MTNQQNPNEYDAVLGGQAVLGFQGKEIVKKTTAIKAIQKLMKSRNMSTLDYIGGGDRIIFFEIYDNWLANYFKTIGVKSTRESTKSISISIADARNFLFPIPEGGLSVRLYCDARTAPEIM